MDLKYQKPCFVKAGGTNSLSTSRAAAGTVRAAFPCCASALMLTFPSFLLVYFFLLFAAPAEIKPTFLAP
jgi:hypothetical protein